MCPLSEKSENNIWSTSRLHSQTCVFVFLRPCCKCLVKSVAGVCSPTIPFLISNGITAHEKAEWLNSVLSSKSCVPNPSLPPHTFPSHTQLFLDTVFRIWKGREVSGEAQLQLCDTPRWHHCMFPKNLLCCYCSSSFCLVHLIVLSGSVSVCLEVSQHHFNAQPLCKNNPLNYRPISLLPNINNIMKFIVFVDIKSFLFSNGLTSDHQFGFRPSQDSLLGPSLDRRTRVKWPRMSRVEWPWTFLPCYPGHAASTLSTMDRSCQYQTWDECHLSGHVSSIWYSLAYQLDLLSLCLWHLRPHSLMDHWLPSLP